MEFLDQGGVVGHSCDNGDVFKVLCCAANHGGTADVYIFDQMAECYTGLGSGFFKSVEVDDHHVDGLDAMGGDGGFVGLVAANVEQAAVDFGMEGLDAAVEHFRKAGQLTNILDQKACRTQCRGSAAGGNEFDAKAGKNLGKLNQAGLVGYAQQGALDFLRRTHGLGSF